MVAVVCAGLFPTHAQTGKPTRPFEFAVHTGPGGGDDVFARAIANMTEQEKLLPVRVQVVKKPGGNSIAGMVDAAERNGESNTIAVLANTWVTAPMTSAETKCSAVESRPGVDRGGHGCFVVRVCSWPPCSRTWKAAPQLPSSSSGFPELLSSKRRMCWST